jgi:hypothetical protein
VANAYKCDICGVLYEYHEGVTVSGKSKGFNELVLKHVDDEGSYNGSLFLKSFDLCPSCCAKVDDLIRNGSEKIERQEV